MKKEILGFNVDALTESETVELIEKYIIERRMCQHVVINAGKVVQCVGNNSLKNIINGCNIINADGQSIVWASKILGNPLPERVAGIDLMHALMKLSHKKGYRIYLFGAKEEVVVKVKETFEEEYPASNIVGYRNGYFSENDIPKIIKDMKSSNADIMFVGFSSPMKEEFLNKYMNELNIPFCMGVGGSFDVVAGVTKRAPKWMQKNGLEWFYRFIQEPRRMWRRYILGNLIFIKIVSNEFMNLKFSKRSESYD